MGLKPVSKLDLMRRNQIKEKNQSGSQLISSLSKCTTDAVDYILERYKSHADKFDDGDVIVIDSIQA